jgi:hypothetical protein
MRVAYIISTCEKYISTRVVYQKETFLKYVANEDIYYLSGKADEPNRIFGWDVPDDPQNILLKYTEFFKNITLDYDWYVFIDDDTFVFPNRIEKMIKENKYNPNDNIYVGKILDHIEADWGLYMSGGAGYIISRNIYEHFLEIVREGTHEKIFRHWCDDLCIGLWIQELAKTQKVLTINNNDFYIELNESEDDIYKAITFHHLKQKEHYELYNYYLDREYTTVVLVTDLHYLYRTVITIRDLRTVGKWNGSIQLITVGFDLPENLIKEHDINEVKFPKIETSELLEKIGPEGFSNSDKREINKLTQWEKLHVFDDYFSQWKRVIFMDSGLRVFDSIDNLLDLDFKGKFVCPNDLGDRPEKNGNLFSCQLSNDKPELVETLVKDFGPEIMDSPYFLNCIWIYDTDILKVCKKEKMIEAMNKYPLCKTNEMGIMNLVLHFKYGLWQPFPWKASNGKYLFDWSDYNIPGSKPEEYCFLKYPSIGLTINY